MLISKPLAAKPTDIHKEKNTKIYAMFMLCGSIKNEKKREREGGKRGVDTPEKENGKKIFDRKYLIKSATKRAN